MRSVLHYSGSLAHIPGQSMKTNILKQSKFNSNLLQGVCAGLVGLFLMNSQLFTA